MVLAADAVAQPGAETWATRLLMAGLDVGDRRVVIDCFGVHRLDEAEIVGALAQVRQQLAEPRPAAAVLAKGEHGRDAGKLALPGSHARQTLAHAHGAGQILAVVLAQLRLVIE